MKRLFVMILLLGLIIAYSIVTFSFDFKYDKYLSFENNELNLQEIIEIHNLFDDFHLLNSRIEDVSLEITDDIDLYITNRDSFLVVKNDDFYLGYMSIEEQNIFVNEDIINFLLGETDNKYSNLEFQYNMQTLRAIVLGNKFMSIENYGIDFFIQGKLLHGVKLVENNYEGIVQEKNNRHYITAFSDGVNTELNNNGLINDRDFSSYGYSLGLEINKELNSYLINFTAEDFISKIFWKDVYTYTSYYYKSSLGLYPSPDDSHSIGNYSYQNYETSLTAKYDLSISRRDFTYGLNYRKSLTPYLKWNILKEPLNLTIGYSKELYHFELSYKNINLSLYTENINPTVSKSATGKLSILVNF
ncbi:hypothetical protein [Natronospora cellulosivora (SeqCode)]